ncbi:MAG: phage tail tape measure protein [Bacilli bacterium]|nr:phage tail tape measure protein [Bacilli bacterium]
MASKYSIETTFKILDGISAPIKKMGLSSKAFSDAWSKDIAKAQLKWKQFGQTVKTMGKVAVVGGLAAVSAGLVDSTKKYIEFEDSITKAGSKFKDLDVTSATFGEDLELLQAAAREVGAQTKYSATDAAGALDKMAMAGMTSKQSMALLMGTTDLATAAGIDLTSAVDMATDALGAFGFASAAKDENELAGYLGRISDVVAKTTNMANTDMNMWFESVKNGASTFTSMGGTLEEFSAMIGVLANAGIKGGEAGTALRNVMLNLGAPSKTASEALKGLGIEVYDAQGNMLPIIDILGQFESALADVDEQTKNKALEDIFGKRNVGSFLTLMSAGTDQIKEYVDTLENSAGTAAAIARVQEQSLKGQIATLMSAFEDKQLSFGKAIMENGGSTGLQKLIKMVQDFDPTPIINLIIWVLDRLPDVINFVTKLISTIWNFKELIFGVVGAFAAYKVITMAVAGVQMLLNGVMAANPIGILVIAIGALIGVIALLKAHWEEIVAVLQRVWDVIVNALITAFNTVITAITEAITWVGNFASQWGLLLGPIGMVLSVINSIVESFDNIKKAFSDGGILAGIKQIGMAILSGILAPIENMLNMLSNIPGIGKYFAMGADKVSGLRNTMNSAPVTQGERMAYSREETYNSVDVNVNLPKGVTGTVSGKAPPINVKTTNSGGL